MKARRIVAVLLVFSCLLLALLTMSRRGLFTDVNSVTAQENPAIPQDDEWHVAERPTGTAVIYTIVSQLNAFKRNDYVAAQSYQSTYMRENFASTDSFRKLIKVGYPEFANYQSVSFGPIVQSRDDRLVQVFAKVTGVDGKSVPAIYIMSLDHRRYLVSSVQSGYFHMFAPLPPNARQI